MNGPRRPGWYRDPGDPARLRHWNGRHWDGRRRHVPSWSIATEPLEVLDPAVPGDPADGPASAAAIPAATSPTGRVRRTRSVAPPAGAMRPAIPPRSASPLLGPALARPSAWVVPRRQALAVTLVVALLVVTVASALTGTGGSAPRVASSTSTFAQRANATCAATLGAVRPATADNAPLRVVSAATVELEHLVVRLRRVAGSTGAPATVGGWLTDWHRWATERLSSAEQPSAGSAATSRIDAQRADTFALGDGLTDCILLPGDLPPNIPAP